MNPRPLGYEPNELPDCSTPRQSQLELPRPKRTPEIRQPDEIFQIKNRKSQIGNTLVGLGRVELPTSRLSGVRSNQLSYRPLGSLPRQMSDELVRRKFRPAKACRNMHHLTQKRATLLFCGPFVTVDTPEGRVASVAIYCLRSTLLLDFERTISLSDLRFQTLDLKIPDRTRFLKTR